MRQTFWIHIVLSLDLSHTALGANRFHQGQTDDVLQFT